MLLIYILLGIIAVGVLLLSPQGRALIAGISTIVGVLLGLSIAAIGAIAAFFILRWLYEGGDLRDTILMWFGAVALLGYVVTWWVQWVKQGKGLDDLACAMRKELRSWWRSLRTEVPKAMRTIIWWTVALFVGLPLLVILASVIGSGYG
jgi:hypothetical protein